MIYNCLVFLDDDESFIRVFPEYKTFNDMFYAKRKIPHAMGSYYENCNIKDFPSSIKISNITTAVQVQAVFRERIIRLEEYMYLLTYKVGQVRDVGFWKSKTEMYIPGSTPFPRVFTPTYENIILINKSLKILI